MVTIDHARHEVKVRGRLVDLGPREYQLLWHLATARGVVLSRQALLSRLWAIDEGLGVDSRAVDQHVCRLRRKIGAAHVLTITNEGYKAVGVQVVSDPADTRARIVGIDRHFGSKPKACITLCVEGVMERRKKGDWVRLA